jgi:hypothetical protein
MRALPLAALAVCAAARPAAADDVDVEGGVSIGYWIGDVAGLAPTGADLHLQAGVGVTPRLFIGAGLDLARIGDDDEMLLAPVEGNVQLASVFVRHPLMSFHGGAEAPFGGDLHVIAGAGHEWTRWDGGGRLGREVVTLGMGGSMVFTHHAIRYGFRFLVARAPDPGKVPAACDGPCEELTRTRPYDRTLVMELGWHFGS